MQNRDSNIENDEIDQRNNGVIGGGETERKDCYELREKPMSID